MPALALAVVPATPLLVPAVAVRSDAALDAMRAATHAGVQAVLSTRPTRVAIVSAPTTATFAGLGVDLGIDGPMPFALGEWLLRAAGWAGPVLSDPAGAGALLVVADGTACRGPQSPGADDPRAEAFDARIVAALLADDPVPLLVALEDDPAAEALRVSGLGAMRDAIEVAGPGPWQAEKLYDAAPFGVGSFVVVRTRA